MSDHLKEKWMEPLSFMVLFFLSVKPYNQKKYLGTLLARLIALNWKILSNIYPTNIFLAKIGKARSSNCSKCDVEDYLEHFFFYCKSVKQLWNEVNSIIQVQMGKNVTLSVTTCLFGYNMGSQVENAFINKLTIIGKLCISKFKYGNHPNLTMLLHQELRLRNIL